MSDPQSRDWGAKNDSFAPREIIQGVTSSQMEGRFMAPSSDRSSSAETGTESAGASWLEVTDVGI